MRIPFLALLGAALTLPAFPVNSIRFSNTSNALTGLADKDATEGTDGLTWGIVIDADRDGFGSFEAFLGLSLDDGADLGINDYFFNGGTTTTVPGSQGGPGAAILLNEADFYNTPGVTGVNADDPFAVIWFESSLSSGSEVSPGDFYGLYENAGFLLPPDGEATTDLAALSAGADPVRPANLAFVPETSTLSLMLLGGLVALRRKRAIG